MISFSIGKKKIGLHYSTYFIADIGANHDGELSREKELIYLAAKAGADAAKFQNFQADKIVSKYGFENLKGQLSHQKKWKKSVYEVYQDASLNPDWTPILKETCQKAGIEYFTSPYDFESVDNVNEYVSVYKIGSGDITWLEIISYIASKGKPVILSTGASELSDVKRAMQVIYKKTKKIVLIQYSIYLKCIQAKYSPFLIDFLSLFPRMFFISYGGIPPVGMGRKLSTSEISNL